MAINTPQGVYWLPQDDYDKAVGQLRLQLSGVFDFLKVDDKLPVRYQYGMQVFIPSAIEEIVQLAEDFGLRVRGIPKPIALELVRRNGRTGNGRD